MINYDDESQMIQWKIAEQPKAVGSWRLGHGEAYYTQFPIFVRPTDEQIKNTEELLGWKWIEEEK
jgi:hypothetical protein